MSEDPTSVPADVLAKQDELLAVVEAVEEYVSSQRTASGYSTSAIDGDAGRVHICWVGPVPGDVEAILDAAADDVQTPLILADFTEDEFVDASKKITSFFESKEGLGYMVTRIVTNERLGGLEIRIPGEADFDQVKSELERVAGVPVLSVEAGEALMGTDSRWTDTAA